MKYVEMFALLLQALFLLQALLLHYTFHYASTAFRISSACAMGALAVLPRFTVAFVLVIALPDADRQEKDLGDEAWLVTSKKEFAIAHVS